jgi:hypothetical protein
VTIVSTNPETLDALQNYLRGTGVAARCTRDLGACLRSAPATTVALVLFPDDFRWEKVVSALADLAAERPKVVPVLVTAQPQRFEDLTLPGRALILPRPAWGWTILDAIRAYVDPAPSTSERIEVRRAR